MSTPEQDKWRSWVEAIDISGVNLTPWEEDFIESLTTKFEAYGSVYLSDRQVEILERIYTERVP